MHQHHDIPDRPDLKQGGTGAHRWVEIDFFWERQGVCVLLDQPERHSPYTRALDLERDELLRGLGIDVQRVTRENMQASLAELQRRLYERRNHQGRVMSTSRYITEPAVNVTRTLAWLRGEPGALAVPADWPRHYDIDLVTWNYQPRDNALVG